MDIKGIHHVALIAADYVASKRFYCEVLGFKPIAETWRAERQSWKLDLVLPDGTRLELFSFPTPPPRPTRPEACGLRHLALRVPDVPAAREELLAQGVTVEELRLDEITGRQFAFCFDPDGLPIELYQEGCGGVRDGLPRRGGSG
jgi:glyoxylase I family protein